MNLLKKTQTRLRALFRKRQFDADMAAEMRSHIVLRTQENLAAGMDPEEARFAALRQFGWTESIKEDCREQRGVRWLENLVQDLRFGGRQLRKNPGFASVAVLTLALGIGANTTIFTLMNTVLLRSLPVKNPGELVQCLITSGSSQPLYSFSYPFYQRLREAGPALSGLFAAGGVDLQGRLIVPSGGNAEREFVRAQAVSGNFFSVLGVPAKLGRTIAEADDRPGDPQAVVVISHAFWQRRFGGDPSVVGKAIAFSDVPFTIVGVAPPGFFGFQPGQNPEIWWPLQMAPQLDGPGSQRLKEGTSWLRLMGRLSPGVGRSKAEAELAVTYHQCRNEFAASRMEGWSADSRARYLAQKFELGPGNAGGTNLHDEFRQPILILMGVVATVLLIACANIASLLLARAAARQREFSIRNALGAGRLRLVRQLLTESLLLASLGGLLGLLCAQGGTRLLQTAMRLPRDPISLSLSPDGRVLLFTTAVALLAGVLFGLAPAFGGTRLHLAAALKGAGGNCAGKSPRQRSLQGLVVAQVGLSLVLLVARMSSCSISTLPTGRRPHAGTRFTRNCWPASKRFRASAQQAFSTAAS